MSSSIFVNKSEFQNYKDCSYTTARKKYDTYLFIAGKETNQELTIYDLANIDKLDLNVVKEKCGKY